MPANLESSSVVTGLENVTFHPNSKEGNAKKYSNYNAVHFTLEQVMLKIF